MRPDIIIIAAAADNLAIGFAGGIPWHISEDYRHFKNVTLGHTVIMGRRTWDSLPLKPLPGRRNIVISSSHASDCDRYPGAELYGDLSSALTSVNQEDEVFIIGGGSIYRQTFPIADKIYLTQVHTVVEPSDTFFPAVGAESWKEISRSETRHDDGSGLDYEFVIYERI